MEKSMPTLNLEQLMTRRITHILLVCSSYDQFTLEEDGRIEAQIQSEYAELSLSNPPQFTRVDDAQTVIDMLGNGVQIDLIISMFNIGGMSPFELSKKVRRDFPEIPFVLLTSFSHEVSRRLESEDTSAIDYVFGWQGNAELLLAIIKMLEDAMNAEEDMLTHGVQGIMLVEDSIRFYSAYLPDLYKIVLTQTNATVLEALNSAQRTLRKRARPKVLFARTETQALEIYHKYGRRLLGVISDVSFSKEQGEGVSALAGVDLCTMIRRQDERIPLLLQSSDPAMAQKACEIGADFIDKNSKTLFTQIEHFIRKRLAFGDFQFVNHITGEVVAVASDLSSLQNAIETMPVETLLHYSRENIFSKWLYSRGLFAIANEIRGVFVENFDGDPSLLRRFLAGVVKDYRRTMGQGVIAEFDPRTYNQYITFARSGNGSLGGKARGLAFIGNMLEQYHLYDAWDGVRITIPRTLALTTEHFERFIADNGLQYVATEPMEDSEILSEFVGSRLGDKLLDELRVFLRNVTRPLAVRSSSKLEDSHYQPFAGIYSTYMVPRCENADRELRLLSRAIKSVYASVFFASSRSYIEATSNVLSEERMGVVIQEMCGSEQDGLYLPTISGVARSLNFYPIGDETPEEGICNIAFGLGKTVVEGGATLRFSPAHPHHALQLSSMELTLRDTQRYFYALNLDPSQSKTSTDDAVNLSKLEVNKATHLRNLRYAASTWDAQNQRISDSPMEKGRKLITFASVLKYDTFPLAAIIKRLLDIGSQELKSPVEIEFAVSMDVKAGEPQVFNFLQIRPIVQASRGASLDWNTVDRSEAILYADHALGTGAIEDVRDIVYVPATEFDASHSEAMAREIDLINQSFKDRGQGYVLVGPGRWGSSDPWLGVPVKWGQISESKVIAECGLENFRVDPSQGTHFFQNLTSFGVGYLTLNPFQGDGAFDVSRLDSMEASFESDNFRVVHFEDPLYIFVDGKNNKAMIR
ncbi:MAG: PEP/pyruvate-binding domain-containing protein [Mucinivorans sp.]